MILDLNLVGLSGIQVLERVQHDFPWVKVIILTGHSSLDTAIQALRLKAVDYLEKPVSPEELLSSIRRVLSESRSERPSRVAESRAAYGLDQEHKSDLSREARVFTLSNGIIVDCVRRMIKWNGQEITLTPIEGRLMTLFLNNHKQLLDHQVIVKEVYGYATSNTEAAKILRTAISRLKRKIGRVPGGMDWIENVRGSGYLLDLSPNWIVS